MEVLVNGYIQLVDLEKVKFNLEVYIIFDVWSLKEYEQEFVFEFSINVFLDQLFDKVGQVGNGKFIVVYCVGGYWFVIVVSILECVQENGVLDIGDNIKKILG